MDKLEHGYIDYIGTEFVDSTKPLDFCSFSNGGKTYRSIQTTVDSIVIRYTRYSLPIETELLGAYNLKYKFAYNPNKGAISIKELGCIGIGQARNSNNEFMLKVLRLLNKAYRICFPDEITEEEVERLDRNSDTVLQWIKEENIKIKRNILEEQTKRLKRADCALLICDSYITVPYPDPLDNSYNITKLFDLDKETIEYLKYETHIGGFISEETYCIGYACLEDNKPIVITLFNCNGNLVFLKLNVVFLGLDGNNKPYLGSINNYEVYNKDSEIPNKYVNIAMSILKYGDGIGESHVKYKGIDIKDKHRDKLKKVLKSQGFYREDIIVTRYNEIETINPQAYRQEKRYRYDA